MWNWQVGGCLQKSAAKRLPPYHCDPSRSAQGSRDEKSSTSTPADSHDFQTDEGKEQDAASQCEAANQLSAKSDRQPGRSIGQSGLIGAFELDVWPAESNPDQIQPSTPVDATSGHEEPSQLPRVGTPAGDLHNPGSPFVADEVDRRGGDAGVSDPPIPHPPSNREPRILETHLDDQTGISRDESGEGDCSRSVGCEVHSQEPSRQLAVDVPSFPHRWNRLPGRDSYRCSQCGNIANTGSGLEPTADGCIGWPAASRQVGSGHRVWKFDVLPGRPGHGAAYACDLCHRTSTGRASFAQPCCQQPTAVRTLAIRRLQKGLHPHYRWGGQIIYGKGRTLHCIEGSGV